MNTVCLTGRLTREPSVNYSNGGSTIARFTLAVNRRFKSEGGPDADFPNIIAFGKTAEFVEKYFHKGMKMDGFLHQGRRHQGLHHRCRGGGC